MKRLQIFLAVLWGRVLLKFGPSTATSLRGVYYRLMAQGKAANETSCLYRTHDGKKCAAGWLISDYLYEPDMEGRDIYRISAEYNLSLPYTTQTLKNAQEAHDSAGETNWADSFDRNWRAMGLPT